MEYKDMFGVPVNIGDRILIKIKFPYCDEVFRKAKVKSFGQNGGLPTVFIEDIEYLPGDKADKVKPTYRFLYGVISLNDSAESTPDSAFENGRNALIDAITKSFDKEKDIDVISGYVNSENLTKAHFTKLSKENDQVMVNVFFQDLSNGDVCKGTENLSTLTANELYDIWKAVRK